MQQVLSHWQPKSSVRFAVKYTPINKIYFLSGYKYKRLFIDLNLSLFLKNLFTITYKFFTLAILAIEL